MFGWKLIRKKEFRFLLERHIEYSLFEEAIRELGVEEKAMLKRAYLKRLDHLAKIYPRPKGADHE